MVVQWLQVHLPIQRASLVAQLVKNVGDLGLIPGSGVGGGASSIPCTVQSMGLQRLGQTE